MTQYASNVWHLITINEQFVVETWTHIPLQEGEDPDWGIMPQCAKDGCEDASDHKRITRGATKGEKVASSKLTVEDVLAIRRMWHVEKLDKRSISVLYGVNFGCIQKVINRVSWAHIPEEDYPHPALLKADGTRTIRRAEDSGPQHSKLTEDEVREIKQMIQQGIPTIDIAEYYRISRSSVRHIATGKRWAHVV